MKRKNDNGRLKLKLLPLNAEIQHLPTGLEKNRIQVIVINYQVTHSLNVVTDFLPLSRFPTWQFISAPDIINAELMYGFRMRGGSEGSFRVKHYLMSASAKSCVQNELQVSDTADRLN